MDDDEVTVYEVAAVLVKFKDWQVRVLHAKYLGYGVERDLGTKSTEIALATVDVDYSTRERIPTPGLVSVEL